MFVWAEVEGAETVVLSLPSVGGGCVAVFGVSDTEVSESWLPFETSMFFEALVDSGAFEILSAAAVFGVVSPDPRDGVLFEVFAPLGRILRFFLKGESGLFFPVLRLPSFGVTKRMRHFGHVRVALATRRSHDGHVFETPFG